MNWINRWLIKCQLFSESCEVTPKNRKGCQFCRFKKCLGCGMKVSQCPSHQWINPSQSDEGHSPCLYNKVSLFIFNFVQNIYFSSLRLKRCWDLVQVSVIDLATIHADPVQVSWVLSDDERNRRFNKFNKVLVYSAAWADYEGVRKWGSFSLV